MSKFSNYKFGLGGYVTGIAAAGAAQGAGPTLNGEVNVVTSSTAVSAIAVQLPADRPKGDVMKVFNDSANAITAYPPTGGAINGGTANAAVSIAANKGGEFTSDGAGNFHAIVGA